MTFTLLQKRCLVFLVTLFLALPFINRAYFVDDHYFVEIAQWLQHHPTQPYHFRTDDAGLQNRGWEENGFVRMVNPLAHHYFLALLLKGGANPEWGLRLGCVLLGCWGALFIFGLAERWTEHPLLATILVLVTPAQWLTSYSLLIDSTMSFFFVAGLYYFVTGAEENSWGRFFASGLLMGLCILSKYPGVLVVPLTGAWLLFTKNVRAQGVKSVVAWSLALGLFVGWNVWTQVLYGAPHVLAASARMVHVYGSGKWLMLFVFFSGSLLVPMASWGLIGARRAVWLALLVFVLGVFFSTPVAGFSKIQGFMIGALFVTVIVFFFALWDARIVFRFPGDWFLILWSVSFLAMMMVVMGWVAVRYYAMAVVPVVFLMVRLLEIYKPSSAKTWLSWGTLVVFIFSLGLAVADKAQAETTRQVMLDLKKTGLKPNNRCFFLGDSFTMSYLKEAGWTPCFSQTDFRVGDVVLAREVTMPQMWFFSKPFVLRQLLEFTYPTWFPIKVMDRDGSAGFYASVWGSLPFTWSRGPWERFHLLQIVGERAVAPNEKQHE